jgi:hypothetical protein
MSDVDGAAGGSDAASGGDASTVGDAADRTEGGTEDAGSGTTPDTLADATEPADVTNPSDTTGPADVTNPSDTTGPADVTNPTDSAQDTTQDTVVDVDAGPAPCTVGPDSDDDGLVDSCDACPTVPKVLLYELFSERHVARDAIARRGCEYEVADIANFTDRLESGDFRLVVMDMPDARPSGEWAVALRDFIADGGGAIIATHRLGQVAGANLPASFGVTWGAELSSPQSFTPTWVVPIHQRPNELRNATWQPTNGGYSWYGAPLTPTAGRVWARFGSGAAIVESNGGRTFVNGFLLDAYRADADRDGTVDAVELIENQLRAVASKLLPPFDWATPTVTNFGDSETVRYRLPIVRGLGDPRGINVFVWNGKDEVRSWPQAGRQWKAMIPLRAGENWVTFETAGVFKHIELDFVPQQNPRKVRFAYIVAKNDSGTFDAPDGESNDIASAQRRIGLAAETLQSMLADRMNAAGLGRNTFNLVTNGNHDPLVHVWNTALTRAEWHAKTDMQMFFWIYDHLSELPACGDCKTVAIIGPTHWDEAAGRAYAHAALGGSGLAIFGSATLYSWAENLDDVVYRLSDDTPVGELSPAVMDDSGGRGRAWANYATGIGAVLHEISHAFDLVHGERGTDIVNRGFDFVNRLIMVTEPESNIASAIPAILLEHEPVFNAAGIGRMRWHRFNALDNRNYSVSTKPTVNIVGNEIRISTNAGVRVVGYAHEVSNGPSSTEWKSLTATLETGAVAPTSYTLFKSTLAFQFPGTPKIRLLITDDQGNLNDDVVVNLP